MKSLSNKYNKSYFDKFSNKKIIIKPFDPKTKQIGLEYAKKLEELLQL